MAKKTSQAEYQKRVLELVKLLSNGAVTSQLIQHASDKWGIGERMAHNYIARARAIIVEDVNQEREAVVAEMLHITRNLIQQAMAKGEYNNALGGMNLITRLGGLEMKQ